MLSVDGFPVRSGLSFLADQYTGINEWSFGKATKIEVADFYLNPREVTWKGKTIWVGDYAFFVMLVKDWKQRYKLTKEQVLDEIFEMSA